jgi:hypothetical protein
MKNAILERLKIIQSQESLTSEAVVRDASDVTSPLHDRFEWDNEIAGHKHRLAQARDLIGEFTYIATVAKQRIATREFTYVQTEYRTTSEVLKNPIDTAIVAQRLLGQIASLHARNMVIFEKYDGRFKSVCDKLKAAMAELEALSKDQAA